MHSMRVAVPDRLKPAFHSLSSVFGGLFPTGQVILGGGMLLESSWSHRESTDVDLFISESDMAHALQGGHQLLHELFDRLDETTLNLNHDESRTTRLGCFLIGRSDDGVEWTFASSPTDGPGPSGPVSVEGTPIRAATFTEIFMGKIAGRAYSADKRSEVRGTQPIPIRDCFDIAVLATQQPVVLERILARLEQRGLDDVVANYRRAPEDLAEVDEKPIINPRWTVDTHALPQRIADAFEARDLSLIPLAKPFPPGRSPRPASPRRGAPSGARAQRTEGSRPRN